MILLFIFSFIIKFYKIIFITKLNQKLYQKTFISLFYRHIPLILLPSCLIKIPSPQTMSSLKLPSNIYPFDKNSLPSPFFESSLNSP